MHSKNYKLAAISGLLAINLVITLIFVVVPKVSAATGCFPDTNGHWAEEFICWLKDKGITSGYPDGTYRPENQVTRAEMAVFLQNTYDLAESNLSNSGEIWIGAGHTNWIGTYESYNLSLRHYLNTTRVYNSSPSEVYILLAPDLPTVLFGKRVQLKAVNFCYNASTSVYIDWLYMRRNYGTSSSVTIFEDTTTRTDETCRRYNLSTPFTLGAYDNVQLVLRLYTSTSNANFYIGQTSFILEATDVDYPVGEPMEAEISPQGSGTDDMAP